MGHSWREMDPAGAAAHDDKLDRLSKLRETFEDLPFSMISSLPIKTIVLVQNVVSTGNSPFDWGNLSPHDIDTLEKMAKDMNLMSQTKKK
jgi:hypothetical protein